MQKLLRKLPPPSMRDFRRDVGGTPDWNFLSMMEAGQHYLNLPVPRCFNYQSYNVDDNVFGPFVHASILKSVKEEAKQAAYLFRYVSPELLAILADTDVGIGTDPERLENRILNKRKEVLKSKIFATCLIHAGLHETVQTVHTITEESIIKSGRQLDFGFSGRFEGVQLGFEEARVTSNHRKSQNIVAIADLRFQFATTESRIRTGSLYKYLTDDCVRDLNLIADSDGSTFPALISEFFGKYGTHVVLKCTHGFRLENIKRHTVTTAQQMTDIKREMMASLWQYLRAYGKQDKKVESSKVYIENLLGVKNIGSTSHMRKALEGVEWGDMAKYVGADYGDAGVISHDWKIMIADVLAASDKEELVGENLQKSAELPFLLFKNFMVRGAAVNVGDTALHIAGGGVDELEEKNPFRGEVSDRLRYWTNVRINDLRGGWNEGLFSVAFLLDFKAGSQEDAVSVTIGGLTTVHACPGSGSHGRDLRVGHVTNISTDEVEKDQVLRVSTSLGQRLSDVNLSKVTVYRRYLDPKDFKGRVLATPLNICRNPKNIYETLRMLFHLDDYVPCNQKGDATLHAQDPRQPEELKDSDDCELSLRLFTIADYNLYKQQGVNALKIKYNCDCTLVEQFKEQIENTTRMSIGEARAKVCEEYSCTSHY